MVISKIKSVFFEVIERISANQTIAVSTARLHRDTFGPYKNYCKGEKDVVICGAGPTLQKYQPIENVIHIGVNRSFLYEKVDFDFIFAQDMDGIRMVIEQLINYRPNQCVKLFGRQLGNQKEIPESLAIKCNALRFNTDIYIYRNGFKSKMVYDIESRPIANMPNVGMSVIQFALYMNPRKLYIVGCDMSGGHFAPGNHTDEEVKAELEEYNFIWTNYNKMILDKWQEIKNFANTYYPETEIISINPVGLKGIFKDMYQEK